MDNDLKKHIKKSQKKNAERKLPTPEEKHLLDLLGGIISQNIINGVKL